MQNFTEADLAHLIQPPQPPQAQVPEKAIDLPAFSPQVEAVSASEVNETEPLEEYEQQGYGEEYEYEQPATIKGWRIRSILVMAWNMFGMAAAWTVVGWACTLPFVGQSLYVLLMAPGTIGLSAMIYFIYLAYFRGLSLYRLEIVFQIVAIHAIVHDFCRLWFNGFPQ